MGVHVMKRGDTAPAMVATITAYDVDAGQVQPVDLTVASQVLAVARQNGVRLFARDVTASGTANGEVTVEWVAGDTDAIGYVSFDFEVTWADGKVQTFPEEGHVRARISLDGA